MYSEINIFNKIIKDIDSIKADGDLLDFLTNQKDKIKHKFEVLNKELEWDCFNISFYGETNAGKSTLIEALRLYFKEETKLQNHKQIEQINETIKNNETKINNNNLTIESINIRKQENDEKIKTINATNKNTLKYAFLYLKERNKIKAFYFWTIFSICFVVFKQSIDKKEILKIQEYCKLKESFDIETKTLEENNDFLKKTVLKTEQMLSNCIFDGDNTSQKTDKTTETIEYRINLKDKKFNIIDMPGIEGDENKVRNEISKALKKSHVVFYISNKIEEKTLEKIKLDLDAKADVYIINNVRTLTLKQFEKIKELESTNFVKSKIKETSQCNYNDKHFTLSALIAFLVLSKHLKEKQHIKKKDEWLKNKNADELLNDSRFLEFANFLENSLVDNIKEKIKISNTKMFISFLSEIAKNFKSILSSQQNNANKIKNIEKTTLEKLSNLNTAAKTYFISLKNNTMQKHISQIRKTIYDFIDKNHSDKEVENQLKKIVKTNQSNFTQQAEQDIIKTIEKIDKEIMNILEDYKSGVKKLELKGIKITNIKYPELDDLTKDIDNGIEYSRLIGAGLSLGVLIGGGLLATTNPAGWVALAFGAISVVINIVKAFVKFFSDDYKMKEQKKATDKYLDELKKSLDKQLNNYYNGNIKNIIKTQIVTISQSIINSRQKLENECQSLIKIVSGLENINKELLCKIKH